MASRSPLELDMRSRHASSRILPNEPLLTSAGLGWHGAQIQLHHQPAWECPEHVFLQHVLSFHHFSTPAKSVRTIAGRRGDETLADGHVVFVPSGTPHHAAWDQAGEFSLILLEPERVAQMADESGEPRRIELIPQHARYDPLVAQLCLALERELRSGSVGVTAYADALSATLAAHLLRCYSVRPPAARAPRPISKAGLRRALDYLHDNFQLNLRLQDMAAQACMSEYHFARTFTRATSMSPHRYLIHLRIEHAQALLARTTLSLEEISLRVGFSSQSHFTAHFRRALGVTPRSYRLSL